MELIVLATRSRGKAAEFQRLLAGIAGRFETLLDHPGLALPPEGAGSYRENALAKARAVCAALGVPALGDDSGLEVDALGGVPGVRSARFAGEGASEGDNNARLLAALAAIPPLRRTARFRCVLALVREPGDEIVVEGICEGRILEGPRGAYGFGYDPLFVPEGEAKSFAELQAERKDRLSHRGRATASLLVALKISHS